MLLRLFLLVAVVLMPLGMQPAVAAPASTHHASTPMQHCPEPMSGYAMKGGIVECTMACSAALPAADLPQDRPLLIACIPVETETTHVLDGLNPDIATPPPKHS